MHRWIAAIAVAAASSTASWFAAMTYADWKRHEDLTRLQSEWAVKCGPMKDIILMRIRDPSNKLRTGILSGVEDVNWERCRRAGVITPDDEQAAYVERQRRQEDRIKRIDLKLPPPG